MKSTAGSTSSKNIEHLRESKNQVRLISAKPSLPSKSFHQDHNLMAQKDSVNSNTKKDL